MVFFLRLYDFAHGDIVVILSASILDKPVWGNCASNARYSCTLAIHGLPIVIASSAAPAVSAAATTAPPAAAGFVVSAEVAEARSVAPPSRPFEPVATTPWLSDSFFLATVFVEVGRLVPLRQYYINDDLQGTLVSPALYYLTYVLLNLVLGGDTSMYPIGDFAKYRGLI